MFMVGLEFFCAEKILDGEFEDSKRASACAAVRSRRNEHVATGLGVGTAELPHPQKLFFAPPKSLTNTIITATDIIIITRYA